MILGPWDIIERDPSVSPVYCVHDGSSPTQGGPLGVIHIRQESKGTLDELEVVRHRVRMSRKHRRPLRVRGSLVRDHRRGDRSLRTVGGRQPTHGPLVYHLILISILVN